MQRSHRKGMRTLNLSILSREQIILLNKISGTIVEDYNALIERIFHATDKSIDWLVSSTLSRNTYANPLFIDLCYLMLVDVLVKSDKEIRRVIVFDKILKYVLDEKFERDSRKIEVSVLIKKANFTERFLTDFKPLTDFLLSCKRMFIMWLIGSRRRKKNVAKNHPLILIDTFFLKTMFKGGTFADRYYPGLLEKLNEVEKGNIFFTPELSIKRYIDVKRVVLIAERDEAQFIFRNDYLKIVDYLFALLSPIRIGKIKFDQFKTCGFAVGPILKTHFRQNVLNWSSILALLNYRFFQRLKEAGVHLKKVIDWNENQMIDRGFNKGIKDYYPDTQSVGYQGYIISTNFNFYIHPTKYEYEAGVIPNEIAVVGKGLVHDAKKFYKKLEVKVAPAFRCRGLWEEEPADIAGIGGNIILVALPIALKESEEIIKLIIDALSIKERNNLCFNFKPHPALNIQNLKKKLGQEWRENFSIITGDFIQRAKESCLMLGNTSSTCIEALALGIPVVIIGSQSGLTQNPIPRTISNDF